MRLIDRLLRRAPGDPGDWGPEPDDAFADRLRTIARSDDPVADDSRLVASRSAVLTAFAAGPAVMVGADEPRPASAASAPGIRRGGRRPAVALATAALVVMAGAGAVAGAAPGGVLYDARLAAEELLLPTGTQDRPEAQVERLDRRLAEAERSLTANDAAGARASLAAFARIAIEAAGEPPPDPVAAAGLAARVRLQLEVLARLAVSDPALGRPRAEADAAARRLLAAIAPGKPGPGGPSGRDPSPSPETPGASERPAASERPGSPTSTTTPFTTPAPRQTPRPEGSPAGPSRTPGPRSTAGPSPAATPRSTTAPGDGDGSGPGGGGSRTPDPGPPGGGSSTTPPPGSPGGESGGSDGSGGHP